jgi:predicted HicB family RNase H-like nuclease
MLAMTSKPESERLPSGKKFWQVAIDEKLHRLFKSRCAAEGKTMNDQVEELIRAWLK